MNARGMDDTGGPQQWYDSLPIITKNWVTAAVLGTIIPNVGGVPIMKMIFDFESISQKFEIWRLFTCFLWLGKFEFQTVISLFLLYQYSKQYESGIGFNTGGGGGTADYCFMLLFGMILILVSGFAFGLGVIFGKALIYYVLYIWSKRNPTAAANIWGVPMQAMYLPFAILGLNFLMGNNPIDYVHGYAAGHIYYFLVDVIPKVYGKGFLQTPLFLISQFGIGEYVAPAPRAGMDAAGNNARFGAPGRVNPPNDPAARTGHNWGTSGQRLGR